MFKSGEKFTLKNITVDVEIVGVFPASQTKDRITEYVATLNGEKMKVKESFFEMLKKAEVKEETIAEPKAEEIAEEKPKKERKKNGRRK